MYRANVTEIEAPIAGRGEGDARRSAASARPRRAARAEPGALPPVVLLGGEANALSVARELAARGTKVFAVGAEPTCVRHSRRCEWIDLPPGGDAEARFADFLLGPRSERFAGAVLLACSDAALQVLARHREALLRRYRLDLAHPPAQLAMLDKLETYQLARAAGVATPLFWAVESRADVRAIARELVFPLMVKPRLSHVFERHFGRKHVIVNDAAELSAAIDAASAAGVGVLLMEVIPGADDQLSSYYTYVDEEGAPLCHYTKRVVRRFPVGMGAASLHITGDVPEIVQPSLRLLRQAGVRGLANVEFKFDARDGRHKLIECNSRFTASNALVAASGLRLASFIYDRAAGRPAELVYDRRDAGRTMRLWDPIRDFAAYRQLRRAGRLTLWRWVRTVMHRQRFPYFAWSDPGPTISRLLKGGARAIGRSSNGLHGGADR